jgi:hypothetical protein
VGADNWINGAIFASYGNPILNIHDLDAFIATLTIGPGSVTASNNVAIFDDDSSEGGHMIARTGADPAPGTTATFVSFSDPVYNDNEAIAFCGMLNVAAGQATTATASGIWADNGTAGTLALIAQQGVTQAPGCPAGATFSAFTELALPDLGGVVFLATLNTNATAGVTTANNLGIWAVDNSGALQLIVRTGDILNVGEDGTPIYKTVTGISFLPALATVGGQSRSFAQGNGDLVYLATFSDGSTAILNVVF